MGEVATLLKKTNRSHPKYLADDDDAVLGSIVRDSSGPITIGNDSNTSSFVVGGTSAAALTTISIGASTSGSALTTVNIGTASSLTTLGIGTGMGSGDTITVGGASSTTSIGGNLDTAAITHTGAFDIQVSGAITIDSSAGTIGIGTDNVNQSISIGTAGARTITVGSSSATAMNLAASGEIDITGGAALDVNMTAGVTVDCTTMALTPTSTFDLQASGAVTVDSSGGAISIGGDANAQAINIGTGAAARTITIGNTTSGTNIQLTPATGSLVQVNGDAKVTGDLTVLGTTTTVETQTLQVNDNFIYLNDGYTLSTPELEGGITVNYKASATPASINVATGGFTAGVAETSNPYVVVDTAQTKLNDTNALPQATITVDNSAPETGTTGFAASGTIYVVTDAGVQTVTYTGVTPTTFTGCSGGTGNMSVGGVVASTATWLSPSDIIQVHSANNLANDGIYEVLDQYGKNLTIKGIGTTGTTQPFPKNQFTTDSTVAGAINKVHVSVIQTNASGNWEVGKGTTTSGWTWNALATSAGSTLQSAYEAGNTIAMTNADGDFTISVGSGTPAILLDAADDSHFTVTGSGKGLTLSAAGGGAQKVIISSAGTGVDAIDLTASAGGFSIDSIKNSNVTVTASGQSLTLEAAGGGAQKVSVLSAGTGVDAVELTASAGGFSIDGVVGSNVTVTASGESLTLAAAGGGAQKVIVSSAGTGTDAIDIAASAGGFSIDGIKDSNVTVTASGQDLVLEAAGGGAQLVRLLSAGTGTDAIDIAASAGGFSIDGIKDSNVTVTASGQDLVLQAAGGGAQQVVVQSAGTGADAVRIYASDSAGGIDIDSGTNGITIDTTGVLSVAAVGSSDITNSTGTLLIATTTSGDISLDSVESVVIDGAKAAATAVSITASNGAGGITAAAGSAGYTIGDTDTAAQTNKLFTGGTAAKNNTIGSTAAASSLTLQTGTGAMTFTAGGAFDVNAAGAFTLDCTTAGITPTSTFTLDCNSTGNIDFNGNVTWDHDARGAGTNTGYGPAFVAGAGGAGSGAAAGGIGGAIGLTAGVGGAGTDNPAAGGKGGTITVTAGVGGASGGAGSAAGAGGDVMIVAADAGATGAGTAGNKGRVGFTSGTRTYYLTAEATTQAAELTTSNKTIIEAINELDSDIAAITTDKVTVGYVTTGLTQYYCVKPTTTDDTMAHAQADSDSNANFIGVVSVVGGAGTGKVVTDGKTPIKFVNGLTTAAGDPVYLSAATAGMATNVAPSGANEVIYQIGYIVNDSDYAANKFCDVQLRFGGRVVI